jgi:gluconolactonase
MRICNLARSAASALLILTASFSASKQTASAAPQNAAPPEHEASAPGQFELRAASPKFWDLVDNGASLEKVATGFSFTEGPVWNEKGGFLYVSEEDQNRVVRGLPGWQGGNGIVHW